LQPDHLSEENLARVRGLNGIAQQRGQSLSQLALSWVLRDARVTSALIGVSSVEQLEQNLAALDAAPLTADELAEVDKFAVESGLDLWRPSRVAG
jgi:L-glyceraldehyde 3-phosphate reductase